MDCRTLQRVAADLDPTRFSWACDEDDCTHTLLEGERSLATIVTPPPYETWTEPVSLTRHDAPVDIVLAVVARVCPYELGIDVQPLQLKDHDSGEVFTVDETFVEDAELAARLGARLRREVPTLTGVSVYVEDSEASVSATAPDSETAERARWAFDLAAQQEDVDLGTLAIHEPAGDGPVRG